MKIFIAQNNPYNEPNPYTYTLIDGIMAQYKDVSFGYGIKKFWEEDLRSYNIVHIMFPDYLCNGYSAEEFTERLIQIKKDGVRIFSTCHNLHSHVWENDFYDILYSNSDCIIHLGEYSKQLLEAKLPFVKHVKINHHIYDNVYTNKPSKEESIKKLRLNSKKSYILAFGNFRKEEERKLIAFVAKHLIKRNIGVLAPTFVVKYNRRNPKYWLKPLLQYWKYKIKAPNLISSCGYVSDEMLPYYYGACDISFIPRLDILNSGSVPMGLYMNHVIVGPDKGNVGMILRELGNKVFDVSEWNSAVTATIEALELVKIGLGDENGRFAEKHLNTNAISRQLYECYKSNM